jgi:pimeloyl-ACP methyl ester carboxylesterase
MPGLFGGATSVDALARQLVGAGEGLEVWAIDRRANLLEDRSAFQEALRRNDPQLAHDYYVTSAGTPAGFTPLPPEAVRFMAYWGLRVHLEDLHAVVREARAQARRVILAGHSLGAGLASLYAAYRFDDGVGQDFLDGLVLLDGSLGRGGGFGRLPSVADLEAGRASPYLAGFGFDPSFFAASETAALLACLDPDGLSPGGFVAFPATNRAVAGIRASDRYAPWVAFSVSVGQAVGARYAGNLLAVILSGSQGLRSRSVAGVAEGAAWVSWELGGYTDLDAFACSWSLPETNYAEWYFPLRLLLELAELEPTLAGEADFVPMRQVTVPTLAIGAGRGLFAAPETFAAYRQARLESTVTVAIVPDLTHLDIVAAKENPVVPMVLAWLP